MDLSLLFLHRQGLAGRPSDEGTPDLPFAGLQPALGSLPSVALSSAGANGGLVRSRGLFPVSVSLGGYRQGNGNGWIELIASAIPGDHTGVGKFSQTGATVAVRRPQSLRNCCTVTG